jgi:lanosterol synthase
MGLVDAKYPHPEPIEWSCRDSYPYVHPQPYGSCALGLTVSSSSQDGSWAQEAIEGTFNRTVAISYPNFKFLFTIWMLGKADSYLKRLKAEEGTNGFVNGH